MQDIERKKSKRREKKIECVNLFCCYFVLPLFIRKMFVCAGAKWIERMNGRQMENKKTKKIDQKTNIYYIHLYFMRMFWFCFLFAYKNKNQMSSWYSCWKIVYHSLYAPSKYSKQHWIESGMKWKGYAFSGNLLITSSSTSKIANQIQTWNKVLRVLGRMTVRINSIHNKQSSIRNATEY